MQSRWDDLESLGYVLLYFLRGRFASLYEKKLSTSIKILCKSYPAEFASYFHYCHSLTFDQRPDYGFLKRMFRDLFTREGISNFDHQMLYALTTFSAQVVKVLYENFHMS
ncbi:hypothetical protein K1719_016028 [Acacia pycnantha]|nr:hypothetical protein K1719_016028 [Acacia pycnantha]